MSQNPYKPLKPMKPMHPKLGLGVGLIGFKDWGYSGVIWG